MTRHPVGRLRVVVIGLAALLGLAACGSGGKASSPGNTKNSGATYQIGYITELAGPLAYAGSYFKNGAEVALSEVNAGYLPHGDKISFDYQEGAGDTAQTIAVYNKFAAKQNVLAVTCCIGSAQAGAIKPVALSKQLPTVFYGATLEGLTQTPYVYRTVELTEPQYLQMAQKLISVYNPKNVAYVETSDSPTYVASLNAQKKVFDDAGVKSLGVDKVFESDTSFASTVTDLVSKKPDVVVLQMVGSQEAALLKGLRGSGYTGPVAVGSSMATASLYKQYGQVLSGAPFPIAYVNGSANETAAAKSFEKKYQAKFNEPASLYSVEGYMAIMLIADGLKKVDSGAAGTVTRTALANALASMTSQPNTPLGTVHYVDGQIQPVNQEYAVFDKSGNVVEWKP